MAAGGDIPHDLSTFVIETTLGIERGFWGCVAEGATFRSLGRKRTEQGRAVIRRHRRELDEAERRVNAIYAAWRRGEASAASEALDRALTEWKQLPDDGELVLEWIDADRRRNGRRFLGLGSRPSTDATTGRTFRFDVPSSAAPPASAEW
jgi:hypothetical protein